MFEDSENGRFIDPSSSCQPPKTKKRKGKKAASSQSKEVTVDPGLAALGVTPNMPPSYVPPFTVPPSFVPPQNVHPSFVPPSNAPQHNAPPQNVPPSFVPPSNAPPQNVPPSFVPPSNAPPHNAPPQNVPPQNVPPQNVPHLMCPRLVCLHLMCLCRFHQTAACLTGIRLSLLSPIGPARPRSLLPQLILPLPRLLHLSMAISGILACLLTTMRSLCSLPTFKNAMVAVQYFPKDPEVLLLIFALSMLVRGL